MLYPDPPDRVRFVRAGLDEAAGRLAELIRQENADLLLSYDPRGGNGHRDHVKVHQVGARAAELTGVCALEATIPRELVAAFLRPLRVFRLVFRYDPQLIGTAGTPRSAITHRVSVRQFASHKRAALAAHNSQVTGKGRSARMFRVLTALPTPIFGLLLGREWFAEPGATATAISDDVLRAAPRGMCQGTPGS